MNGWLVATIVGFVVVSVIEYVAYWSLETRVGSLERVEDERLLTVSQVAQRWGITSLDAVESIMQAKGYFFSLQDNGGYSLGAVERVERRLLMPDAVARFIDSADV